jgi:hypothetical protein
VFSALSDGAVGRGSARAGASRLASPQRLNQTETLRFRLAAAIVTADKQIGPGPSFSKRSRGSRLVSGHTKACYESDRGGSFVGSSILVEAAGKPRLGRSLALPRRSCSSRSSFSAVRAIKHTWSLPWPESKRHCGGWERIPGKSTEFWDLTPNGRSKSTKSGTSAQ